MEKRKAKKQDFDQYLKLKRQSTKEYSKLIGEKITFTDKQVKKEFNEFFSSGKRFLLIAKEDKRIIGYLIGTIVGREYQLMGYIDDIFVLKNFRNKKIGICLIKEFIEILKQNRIRKCRLGVNLKNKKAIHLYKKLGFKIKHYEMDKKIRWKKNLNF
jgi:ribosomal protein S18 acetylase RimI-like enzyme